MGVSVIEASVVGESVKPSPKMSSKLSPTGAPVNPKPKKSSVAGAAVKSNPQISSKVDLKQQQHLPILS
jgi:hypothetical protein